MKNPTLFGSSEDRKDLARKKKTIDMVTRLYVSVVKSDAEISSQEINILYSLLINLFRYVDVSWEVYVRRIIEHEFDLSEVISYLGKHLNQLDKARVLLSMIIMVKTDKDFALSEITHILDLSKSWGLDHDGFINLIDKLEYHSRDLVAVSYGNSIANINNSLFTDYVLFGRDIEANLRFRNPKLASQELFLMAIDTFLFIGTSANTIAEINGAKLRINSLYLLPEKALLKIAENEYDQDTLWKIYQAQNTEDDIAFSKADYDFLVHNSSNRYCINVYHGTVYLNGKALVHNRQYHLFHDDTLQIRGYSPFQLIDVIRERSRIGVNTDLPSELYVDYNNSYFFVSRTESTHSLAMIEIKDAHYILYPPKRGWDIFLNQEKLLEPKAFRINADIISINKHSFRLNSFHDLIEIPFELEQLSILDVKHFFADGQLALDSVSFTARKGELLGILGQSGSGKSTLLKTISTEIMPTYGEIQVDGKSIYSNISYYTQFFGYVPQDDLLYPYLTVYENLWYRGRLRMPKLAKSYLDQKINNILQQVNLMHRKDTRVGDHKKKLLSGGERKRLNIALELLFEPTVIICDEPTSGLSYNDTEQIIDILKNLTDQGKIIIITIHQPSSTIFKKFDEVLLMDMGGRQVYYGSPTECFAYFDTELGLLSYRKHDIEKKKTATTSDYMYEVILYPEYNQRNEPVYEQANKMLQVKRKFPPEYWRDKYKRKMLYDIIQHEHEGGEAVPFQIKKQRKPKKDLRSQIYNLLTFIHRSFTMKLRNRLNNIITFIEAPLLAVIVSFILRLAPEGESYSYSANQNIGIYVFVSIIAFIFMGLSNSIEEIYDERKIILREKLLNLKTSHYLLSKIVSLTFFSLVQVILYVSISSLILEIPGLSMVSIMFLLLSSMVGYSLGLLTSAFIKDKGAIINLLPLVLIPQIIFGGAVIEFERMNKKLTLRQSSPIPEVVQIIPSRWLFEGMTTAYAKNNAFHRGLASIEKKKLTYITLFKENEISKKEFDTAIRHINDRKADLAAKWNPDRVNNEFLYTAVSLMDGRYANSGQNVFMSSYKSLRNREVRTWTYALLVLFSYIILLCGITLTKLKYLFRE